jgi:hypothetical protein
LERLLRERLPDAVGVTDAQIAAAQDHLGVALPAELVTLYRITQGGGRDDDDHAEAVHCRLLPIDRSWRCSIEGSLRPA